MDNYREKSILAIFESLEDEFPDVYKLVIRASRRLPESPVHIEKELGEKLVSFGFLQEKLGIFILTTKARNLVQAALNETQISLEADILMLNANNKDLYSKLEAIALSPKSIQITDDEIKELIEAGVLLDDGTVHYLAYKAIIGIAKQRVQSEI